MQGTLSKMSLPAFILLPILHRNTKQQISFLKLYFGGLSIVIKCTIGILLQLIKNKLLNINRLRGLDGHDRFLALLTSLKRRALYSRTLKF